MDRISIFFGWYMISVDVLALASIFFFIKLPATKQSNSQYWLPFLIVTFSAFYENLGAYFWYNVKLNTEVNIFLGNNSNPKYTIWFYNIFNQELLTILLLSLIKLYLPKRKKQIINWLLVFFVLGSSLIQLSGVEPLHGSQPMIFSISAGSILIGCGLYFLNIISNDQYLEINPLRLPSFWQSTFLLFYFSAIFLNTVSEKYLWTKNYEFGKSLSFINVVVWIVIMLSIMLSYTGHYLNLKLDKEPSCV